MTAALEHLRLYVLAAVDRLIHEASLAVGGRLALHEEFPFLASYEPHLRRAGAGDHHDTAWWERRLADHEVGPGDRLPLVRLSQAAALDRPAVLLLVTIGLVDDDARFGAFFSRLQGTPDNTRPTAGLLAGFFGEPDDSGAVRTRLARLRALALVEVVNPAAPRSEWALAVPGPVSEALRGEAPSAGARHAPLAELHADEPMVLPAHLGDAPARFAALLACGEARALVVRGPEHNGRRTFVRAVARALGRGILELPAAPREDGARHRVMGPVATLLHALPVIVGDPGAGETLEAPALPGYTGPIAFVLGHQGGLVGAGAEAALSCALDLPGPTERREHWRRGLGASPRLDALVERFRMSSGNIRRATTLARAHAAMAGRADVELGDIQRAARSLHRQALETLAVPLPAGGDWTELAVSAETMRELRVLESRCRHRERLAGHVGAALARHLTPGVRALFQGPSGTGKTLAARLLAAALDMDLYRVDLPSVVSKYIGETERNLARLFSLAEELDVILLFDEGDSLLARRTGVSSSNDRYANLETNYVLQRIESFEGVLIVTTNAPDAIDDAFQRRLDVVVDFRAPDVAERWSIWQLHLPDRHAVDEGLLRDVAARCALSGGQIRNAVLHATTLSLDEGAPLRTEHLEDALLREYRKMGVICPLRKLSVAAGGR
jgi:hypothetical protein